MPLPPALNTRNESDTVANQARMALTGSRARTGQLCTQPGNAAAAKPAHAMPSQLSEPLRAAPSPPATVPARHCAAGRACMLAVFFCALSEQMYVLRREHYPEAYSPPRGPPGLNSARGLRADVKGHRTSAPRASSRQHGRRTMARIPQRSEHASRQSSNLRRLVCSLDGRSHRLHHRGLGARGAALF